MATDNGIVSHNVRGASLRTYANGPFLPIAWLVVHAVLWPVLIRQVASWKIASWFDIGSIVAFALMIGFQGTLCFAVSIKFDKIAHRRVFGSVFYNPEEPVGQSGFVFLIHQLSTLAVLVYVTYDFYANVINHVGVNVALGDIVASTPTRMQLDLCNLDMYREIIAFMDLHTTALVYICGANARFSILNDLLTYAITLVVYAFECAAGRPAIIVAAPHARTDCN